MATHDDDMIRMLGEIRQQLSDLGQVTRDNRSNGDDIRKTLKEMSGSLAVVISWAQDNKKKSPVLPPLFGGLSSKLTSSKSLPVNGGD